MGRYINLYSYDCDTLLKRLKEFCNTEDVELLKYILLSCGNILGDRYIILNQEFRESENSYCIVASMIDKYFNTDDCFGKVFCSILDPLHTEMKDTVVDYEIEDKINKYIKNREL